MGRPFVRTGVGRIDPAGVDGPVVPAPDRSREEPDSRITTLGGGTGWKPELVCFYSRAFRFARRYLCSRGNCQPLRAAWAIARALRRGG